MTATTANKDLEQKLRRALNKHGYSLHRSRKPISIDNMGGYMIVEIFSNFVVSGFRFDLSLAAVADWLREMLQ